MQLLCDLYCLPNFPFISRLIFVLLGNWMIDIHACRLGLPFNPFFRSCREPETEGTVLHLVCGCFQQDLSEVLEVKFENVLKHLNAAGCLKPPQHYLFIQSDLGSLFSSTRLDFTFSFFGNFLSDFRDSRIGVGSHFSLWFCPF